VKRGAAALSLTPFRPLPAPDVAPLEEEGDRLLRYLAPESTSTSVHLA
jgi:hypothetical protein